MAVSIECAHRDVRGAFDIPRDLRDGETPFFRAVFPRLRDDLWIDQDERTGALLGVRILAQIDHRHAFATSHLWRSNANAFGGIHRLEHVIDEMTQLVGDRQHWDGMRLLAQNRIAQYPNAKDGHRY